MATETETEETEKDFTVYAGKAPTAAQEHFADWVIEVVDLSFATKKEEAAFRDGIRLGKALVMSHQKSPEWRERAAEIKEERATARAAAEAAREREAEEAPASAPKPAAKKAGAAKRTAAAAPAEPAPAKKAAAKKTTRRAAAAAPADDEAPF